MLVTVAVRYARSGSLLEATSNSLAEELRRRAIGNNSQQEEACPPGKRPIEPPFFKAMRGWDRGAGAGQACKHHELLAATSDGVQLFEIREHNCHPLLQSERREGSRVSTSPGQEQPHGWLPRRLNGRPVRFPSSRACSKTMAISAI